MEAVHAGKLQAKKMIMMTGNNAMPGNKRKMALMAGGSLVAMALLAGFAYGYVFENVYDPADSSKTFSNLSNNAFLFSWAILAFLAVLVLDVVVAWALYIFLKPADNRLSLLMALMRLAYTCFLAVALWYLMQALQLAKTDTGNGAAVMNSLRSFLDVWSLGLIVFGGHLFLLGCLLMRASYVPDMLGILAVFAAVCYTLTNLLSQTVPGYAAYREGVDTVLSLPMALGEICLAIWLLVKGGKAANGVLHNSFNIGKQAYTL